MLQGAIRKGKEGDAAKGVEEGLEKEKRSGFGTKGIEGGEEEVEKFGMFGEAAERDAATGVDERLALADAPDGLADGAEIIGAVVEALFTGEAGPCHEEEGGGEEEAEGDEGGRVLEGRRRGLWHEL